ncbi:MAG: hypothetical protein IPM58_15225 [Nitrospira sp.]|nr:hypothetical protein [Nitrospira sp.]
MVRAAATARAKHGVFPFAVSPEDINLSEQELAAERLKINVLTEGQAQGEVPACHFIEVSDAETARTREGKDPSSLYREGLALKESGEYTQAIVFFDRLATQNSWAVKALAQKGLCLKAVGRHEEALGVLQEASTHGSATHDESRAVRYLWARTLESNKQYDEAREVYVVLSIKDPPHITMYRLALLDCSMLIWMSVMECI